MKYLVEEEFQMNKIKKISVWVALVLALMVPSFKGLAANQGLVVQYQLYDLYTNETLRTVNFYSELESDAAVQASNLWLIENDVLVDLAKAKVNQEKTMDTALTTAEGKATNRLVEVEAPVTDRTKVEALTVDNTPLDLVLEAELAKFKQAKTIELNFEPEEKGKVETLILTKAEVGNYTNLATAAEKAIKAKYPTIKSVQVKSNGALVGDQLSYSVVVQRADGNSDSQATNNTEKSEAQRIKEAVLAATTPDGEKYTTFFTFVSPKGEAFYKLPFGSSKLKNGVEAFLNQILPLLMNGHKVVNIEHKGLTMYDEKEPKIGQLDQYVVKVEATGNSGYTADFDAKNRVAQRAVEAARKNSADATATTQTSSAVSSEAKAEAKSDVAASVSSVKVEKTSEQKEATTPKVNGKNLPKTGEVNVVLPFAIGVVVVAVLLFASRFIKRRK